MISSLALAHRRDATLWLLLLRSHNLAHTHTHLMLRYYIFPCTCTETGCYTMISSFALAQICIHTWCYGMISSLVLAHALDATLWCLFLHLRNLARTHTWCYVTISSLALAHAHTHTWCYVMISSIALARGRDATSWYLLLHWHNLACALDATLLCLLGDRIYQRILRLNLANWQLTDKHEKMEHVQIRLLVVTWSKHIIHKIATLEAACDWIQRLKILGKS